MAIAYNSRGVAFKSKREFDRALQDYDQAIRLNPYGASRYNNRGVIYRIKGDYARAIQEYSRAIMLQGDYLAAYYNRALAYSDFGQYETPSRISMSCCELTQTMRMDCTVAACSSRRWKTRRLIRGFRSRHGD